MRPHGEAYLDLVDGGQFISRSSDLFEMLDATVILLDNDQRRVIDKAHIVLMVLSILTNWTHQQN
jgi:hypothetical protein